LFNESKNIVRGVQKNLSKHASIKGKITQKSEVCFLKTPGMRFMHFNSIQSHSSPLQKPFIKFPFRKDDRGFKRKKNSQWTDIKILPNNL